MLILGNIPLIMSVTNKDPFERSQNDLFYVEAMDVGIPKKIKYGVYIRDEHVVKLSTVYFLELVMITVPQHLIGT